MSSDNKSGSEDTTRAAGEASSGKGQQVILAAAYSLFLLYLNQ